MERLDAFERPAAYWLRRANRLKGRGDTLRAAALERHALRTDPGSDLAADAYVASLMQLGCGASALREAFAALAHDPSRCEMYSCIAGELMQDGYLRAALDACALYDRTSADMPDVDEAWDMRTDTVRMMCELLTYNERGRSRVATLWRMARRALEQGRTQQAEQLLARAWRKPVITPEPQYEALCAQWLLAAGFEQEAQQRIAMAARLPGSVYDEAHVAESMWRMGMHADAHAALLRAAGRSGDRRDRRAVCRVSDLIGAPQIALCMLQMQHNREQDTIDLRYDLGVCLIKLGRAAEAEEHIRYCFDRDPDDVQCGLLWSRMPAIMAMHPQQQQRCGRDVGYYGALSEDEVERLMVPLCSDMQQDLPAFAASLKWDVRTRRRLICVLLSGAAPSQTLLRLLVPHMDDAECFLRELLTGGHVSYALGRAVCRMLSGMGAKPPYIARRDRAVVVYDPNVPFVSKINAYVRNRITVTVYAAAAVARDRGLIPWAMGLIHRMGRRDRICAARDRCGAWSSALALAYARAHGLPAPVLGADGLTPQGLRELADARRAVKRIMEGMENEDH